MKKMSQFTVLLLAALATGCASTGCYFPDRGRDAADMFTVVVGVGAGAKTRVGPVQTGLLIDVPVRGLRGGTIHDTTPALGKMTILDMDAQWLIGGVEASTRGHPERKNQFAALSFLTQVDDFARMPPFIHATSPFCPSYFTQIEVAGGLLGTARLGFNPGSCSTSFLDGQP